MNFRRKDFKLEECHNRKLQVPVFDFSTAKDGELDYLQKIADLWKASGYPGVRNAGETLTVAIDMEMACREWTWSAEQAQFDAIAAANQPDPLPTPDLSSFPKWSDLPPEYPDVD